MEREKLGSRLGFIMLSAGCAIGCGNVWKFPWMCGQGGGGGFLLFYFLFLIILGLPVMTMEFSVGRKSQASALGMYQKIEKPGQKWHIHGWFSIIGMTCLMAFYTVVTGWMIKYFVKFVAGTNRDIGFVPMITDGAGCVKYLAIAVAIAMIILCFNLQGGLERVTKILMVLLLCLMLLLAIRSVTLPGAKEGLAFYLVPDFSKISGSVIVGAMNQAFFSLSLGIGSMAIFGSYIDKKRSLLGESVNIVCLDTFVALIAGFIIFPACFTYNLEVGAGPALLFDTMATVFNNMAGGRLWGSLFFLFMVFAAVSTELAVFEAIIAGVREKTGWNRAVGSIVCSIAIFCIALTTALGYSVLHFQPFAEGTAWLDLWDFVVSTNLLPLGSLCFALFCTNRKFGWGWDNFLEEANTGEGMKIRQWMKPIFTYVVPLLIIIVYIYGLATFNW